MSPLIIRILKDAALRLLGVLAAALGRRILIRYLLSNGDDKSVIDENTNATDDAPGSIMESLVEYMADLRSAREETYFDDCV